MASYSDARRVTDVLKPDYSSAEGCLKTIKDCEVLNQSDKRNNILHSSYQGRAIKALKAAKDNNIVLTEYFLQNGIRFSSSYCRSLVLLSDLVETHPTLLKCSIDLGTILHNMKQIRVICAELGW